MSKDITLLVDAGNTRVKFGWMRSGSPRREADILALPHDALKDAGPWLASLPGSPQAAVGVSVARAHVVAQIEELLLTQCGVSLRWLRSGPSAAGVENLYEQPEQLGNDRWVALLGLSQHARSAAMLASFGTATTIDTLGPCRLAVDCKPASSATDEAPDKARLQGAEDSSLLALRAFEGGLILPGPELMRQSLALGTAGLPYAMGESTDFPRNTHSAISTGVAAAQAGAVLRQWRTALERLGEPPRLYCSGGGWPLVADEVQAGLQRLQTDLGLPRLAPEWLEAPVLDGLAVMATAPLA